MGDQYAGDCRTQTHVVHYLSNVLNQSLKDHGFEVAPFLVGWYNSLVSDRLKLDHSLAPYEDCVAFCIISNPLMFEKSFLPLLESWFQQDGVVTLADALKGLKFDRNKSIQLPGANDPLDWSVLIRLQSTLDNVLKLIEAELPADQFVSLSSPTFIPDFALRPVTRYPYVHVQSTGHVSGIAYFHRIDKHDLNTHAVNGTIGCSLHPVYGGWFGFRGIFIFPHLRCPDLPRPVTISSLPPGHPPFCDKSVNQLVGEYRNNWREFKWRDFGLSSERHQLYSAAARMFFNTPPSKRAALIEGWMKAVRNATMQENG